MSPAAKSAGKISRVTFNAAVRPILSTFASTSGSLIYPALNGYVNALYRGLVGMNAKETLINPTVFRAVFEIFPDVAQRVVDRAGSAFTESDFADVLRPMFEKVKPARLKTPPRSHKELAGEFLKALKTGFLIG